MGAVSKDPKFPLVNLYESFGTNRPSERELADILGVERQTLRRWKETGVPLLKADRLACKLGMHPAEIWGEDWWTKF